ncbi:MAG TPA: hypothetical protein VE197_09120 [Mycobacterium sp.]|nr:hypothetical protein [Mycobacterium sp.]
MIRDSLVDVPDRYSSAVPLLQPLWQARGRLREGLAWFDAALADLDAQHPGVAPAVHEFTGGRVQACLGHRDAVQGSVELPNPGARQSVSLFV